MPKEALKEIKALKEEVRQADGYPEAKARAEPMRCKAETDGNGRMAIWAERM